MAYTTIDKPSDYFVSNLHTGNGGTLNITSLDFQPDWVWVKERNNAKDHALYDSVRGANKLLESNKTGLEATTSAGISSFNSDGWTTGDFFQTNDNGDSYVSWNWKAGTSFTNDASATGIGSIDSAGSFNNDSGFSIVSYTGTGSSGTIKHGLNSVPSVIIIKVLTNTANDWCVYHQATGNNQSTFLSESNAASSNAFINNTTPTSSVFSVDGSNYSSGSSRNYIAYCFAEKQGYSKFSSFVGNGSNDGTFSFCGFKPAMVIYKKSSGTENWFIHDNKRQGFNPENELLFPDLSNAEGTVNRIDLLSNGFKATTSDGGINASGATYIYMAFAENPFVTSTGVPACAR